MTNKQKAINALFAAFCTPDMDMDQLQHIMTEAMKVHGIVFLSPKDIDPIFTLIDVSDIEACYFEMVNSPKYNDLPYFAYLCENFMDFSVAISKDHAELYPSLTQVKESVLLLAAPLPTPGINHPLKAA